MHPHALPLAGAERPGLVPDRVRDAQAAEVVHEAGAPQQCAPRRRPGRAGPAGSAASSATRARVTERVGRLEVDEVRDRLERGVELARRQHDGQRGLGVDHRAPSCAPSRGRRRSSRRSRADESRRARDRTACRCAAAPGRRAAVDAAEPVRHLDELGQLRRSAPPAGLPRPPSPPGQPVPVPALVGPADRLEHRRPAARARSASDARQRGVLGDHAVDLAVPGERELEPDAKAVQRRVARRRGAACVERRRRAGCGRRGRTCSTSARCRRRTTSPARARPSGSRR